MRDMFEGPNVPFDPDRHVKKAARYEMHFCGHCPNLHVIFFDEHDVAFCDATFTAEQLARMAIEAKYGNSTH